MSSDTLALTIETDGDITIFAIRNRRVVPEMSEAFEQQVVRATEGIEHPKVLIDFAGVEFISSAMLGKLIKLNGRVATDQEGELVLSALDRRITEVLKITGLEGLFSIHATRSEALAAFT